MRGEVEILRGFPDLLGLDFDAGDRIHDDEGGVGDAQRRARVAEEIAEPGRVDQIDLVLVPLGVREACGKGVLAGDFFFVVVGDRRPIVHASEAIDHAGGERRAETSWVLPVPPWPTRATLRMLALS